MSYMLKALKPMIYHLTVPATSGGSPPLCSPGPLVQLLWCRVSFLFLSWLGTHGEAETTQDLLNFKCLIQGHLNLPNMYTMSPWHVVHTVHHAFQYHLVHPKVSRSNIK